MNITTNDSQILLALNKPKGYLVTRSDDLGRKTVYNLLPIWLFQGGWMPIGRLDLESKASFIFPFLVNNKSPFDSKSRRPIGIQPS